MSATEQILVCALVVFSFAYVVRKQWHRYFSGKAGCGGDCNCGVKDAARKLTHDQRAARR